MSGPTEIEIMSYRQSAIKPIEPKKLGLYKRFLKYIEKSCDFKEAQIIKVEYIVPNANKKAFCCFNMKYVYSLTGSSEEFEVFAFMKEKQGSIRITRDAIVAYKGVDYVLDLSSWFSKDGSEINKVASGYFYRAYNVFSENEEKIKANEERAELFKLT